MKKGISLIVLVITIIIMIIIAGAIILSLSKDNVLAKASLSKLTNERASYVELAQSRQNDWDVMTEAATLQNADIFASQTKTPYTLPAYTTLNYPSNSTDALRKGVWKWNTTTEGTIPNTIDYKQVELLMATATTYQTVATALGISLADATTFCKPASQGGWIRNSGGTVIVS